MNLRRLGAIVVKEVRQLRRDRVTLAMILGIPVLDEDGWSRREWDAWVESWEPDGYNRWELERVLGRELNTPTEDPDDDELSLLTRALVDLEAYQGDNGYGEMLPACTFEAIAYELTGDERFKAAQ